ncbi:hypothetical protein [Oligoflexus tunisiensis]|uniref:hypothetical protein n=1 Tax=Oligoflexus tunisiensis TaxID=708132 RepID=UPI00114CB5DC|nr:hypothetical protein [Oligoflexus tunisiensis]
MDLPTASIREFARIVGVNHSAVLRAIKNGTRLEGAVIQDKDGTRIIISLGCHAWIQNKDHRKDNRPADTPSDWPHDEMSVTEANRVKRHYEALLEKLTFEREAGRLTSIEKFRAEAFTVARGTRDSLLNVPNESEFELKRLVVEFLRKRHGNDSVTALAGDLDEMGLAFRTFQKATIRKALRDMLDERFGAAVLSMEKSVEA